MRRVSPADLDFHPFSSIFGQKPDSLRANNHFPRHRHDRYFLSPPPCRMTLIARLSANTGSDIKSCKINGLHRDLAMLY